MSRILTPQYKSNLTLVETSEIALPYLMVYRPNHVQNVFMYESNQNMFLISTGDILEEGDTVHSQPSGVVLEHRHGQLVIYEENTEDNSTLPPNILWQTQPYLDDGGSIRSMFHFGQDCNIIIYSDTVQQRPEVLSEESALWQSWTWLNNVDTCSLVWDPLQKKPLVQGGTIENPTRKTTMIENSWEPRNLTATSNELPLILPSWTKVMQGFMIESDPPGYVLQHTDGNLYLYDDNPVKNSRSSILWRTEGAYTYIGNADLTWSMLRMNTLAIRAPHMVDFKDDAPWLWRTNVYAIENGGDCYDGSCFLTWIAEEERLVIFKGTIDSPVAEMWTSENFVWEPAHTNLSSIQQDTVMVLVRFSAALSIIGSGIIIAIILCRWITQSKTINTRDRLIFCMSFLDFLSSTAHLLNVTLIPRNTYGIRGAIGTEATCTAQGFFIQLGFSVPLYNCMVCVYVLLVVRFKCTERFVVSRVEPVMHFFAWLYALGTGLLGVFLELYNSNGSFCWVEQYPHDCSDMPHVKCDRGVDAYFYQWMFAGVTLTLTFMVIVTSMTWLYCHIRWNKMKMVSRFGSAAVGNNRQLNEVGKQALLYVAAFMITFIWPMAIAIQRHYWVAIPIFEKACMSFFLPLQGFWNFGIYIRPMYNRVCHQNPARSFFWVLKTSIVRDATKKHPPSFRRARDNPQSSKNAHGHNISRRWSLFRWQSTSTSQRQGSDLNREIYVDQNEVVENKNSLSFDEKAGPMRIGESSRNRSQTRRGSSLECILENVQEEPCQRHSIHIEDDAYLISNPCRRSSRRRDLDIDLAQVEMIELGTGPGKATLPRRNSLGGFRSSASTSLPKRTSLENVQEQSRNERQRHSIRIVSNPSSRRPSRRRDLDIDLAQVQKMVLNEDRRNSSNGVNFRESNHIGPNHISYYDGQHISNSNSNTFWGEDSAEEEPLQVMSSPFPSSGSHIDLDLAQVKMDLNADLEQCSRDFETFQKGLEKEDGSL